MACFTPAGRRLGLAVALAFGVAMAATGTVTAQPLPDGCFARDYSAEHLADHPDQVVAALRIRFIAKDNAAEITAVMANQGHAARDGIGGLRLWDLAYCQPDGGCAIECDGGRFHITRNEGDMIEVRTDYARVSTDTCAGGVIASDLAEIPGAPTTYRLFRADPSQCPSNF